MAKIFNLYLASFRQGEKGFQVQNRESRVPLEGKKTGWCDMDVLLLRPNPGNERFGLGPFFRVEPLGLEYIGAALRAHGHAPTVADLRFRPGATSWVRRTRPAMFD